MITTKAEVLNYIEKATESLSESTATQLSAQSVSRTLSISRSLASQYLNELYREKYFIKISSRPVLYIHKEVLHYTYGAQLKSDEYLSYNELQQELELLKRNDDINDLVGSHGTIKHAIDQLKASIGYPPFGLPLLMIGLEGTGKETLVAGIYQYAVRNKIIENDKYYKHVNFKETSLKEILKENDQSIGLLYCSNIQALEESERMLLLDIASRKQPYLETAFIIMSTSNVSHLDDEFISEIPMKTTLKNFENRYLEERRELIVRFLKDESLKLKRSIEIQKHIIDLLANTIYEGQIGELKKVIKTICAQAHAQDNGGSLVIKLYHVDQYVDASLQDEYLNQETSDENVFINNIELFDEQLFEHYKNVMLSDRKQLDSINSYTDYLLNDIEYDEEHIEDIKQSLSYLFNVHTLINQQPFFSQSLDLIALMIYTIKRNYKFINQWENVNNHLLQNVALNVRNEQFDLFEKVELVILSIYNYTGVRINTVNEIVLLTKFAQHVTKENESLRKY